MVETVQQYWPKGRSWVRKEWTGGRYRNTLIRWHYELKNNNLETRCILVYKTILIKKNHYIFFQTHTILHSRSQTCRITNDHTHRCLHYFSGLASFFVECESAWGPTGKNNNNKNVRWGCLHQSGSFHTSNYVFTKMSIVHEQVSDMQTSTLSRNKYTRGARKKVPGGLTAFDKCDTDTLIEDIQKHSTVWLCHQQYGHTDIIGQGHFFKRSVRNQEWLLIDRNLPWGAYFPLPCHKEGKCVEVCLPLRLFFQSQSSFNTAECAGKRTKAKRHTEALQ